MFELTFPRHGALLNRRHGTETKEGLTIVASGVCDSAGSIAVNGLPVQRRDRRIASGRWRRSPFSIETSFVVPRVNTLPCV